MVKFNDVTKAITTWGYSGTQLLVSPTLPGDVDLFRGDIGRFFSGDAKRLWHAARATSSRCGCAYGWKLLEVVGCWKLLEVGYTGQLAGFVAVFVGLHVDK